MTGSKIAKRTLFKTAAALGVAASLPEMARGEGLAEIASGPFKPDWASLTGGYTAPEWFRDAKFGIWAHWGPQCAPEFGDWYARKMYLQGDPVYAHHLKRWGHPADSGFIDVIREWKAEHFDPDALLDLYAKAGAKYFVALANHHDNFDTYASKFHAWNATRVGPKRDVLGMFAKAARAKGLHFGVSNHSAHSWHWLQVANGYDPEGARRGQRYDAYNLTRAMGKGKWWEGLDPQELYSGRLMPMPDGFTSIKEADAWHEKHDGVWDENPPMISPAFTRSWFLRCKDLIDSYQPDLLYFDNTGLPLGQAGLDIAAHYYNASLKWHGKVEAVINCKYVPEARRKGVVEDTERGLHGEIGNTPWQTDTCLGDWHYSRPLYERGGYKSAALVIHFLCDVVSKNGNLLLSVPVRSDGTIDEKERAIVEDIASWMGRFGEAIYGTRPWKLYGEGPTSITGGAFGEEKMKSFTAEDIRYTTKAGALYAITMGRPTSGKIFLPAVKDGKAERVEVVGATAPLSFTQDSTGLVVNLPSGAGHDFGVALKIQGQGLI
ncbi:alpha-L-fucosidase [Rhizomicrobium palustre]|uniref:alpha-L-fucosidase n=1 Tax=Rhizomicrobium palustre TaxID=189966 RepID=A0A846MXA9_9PROT|nr:alpha-L-fucosidase [Rhizomicrobium palustre]NIK87865.1 alpha-L-fucosidase [Rhizomicrobium palustre]